MKLFNAILGVGILAAQSSVIAGATANSHGLGHVQSCRRSGLPAFLAVLPISATAATSMTLGPRKG
jgi:hypothetical protein